MLLVQIMKKLVAAGNNARIGAIIAKLAEVGWTGTLAECSTCPKQRAVQHAPWRL
jgi:hypothetical protein